MATPMQDSEEHKSSLDHQRRDENEEGLLPRHEHEMDRLDESDDEDDELEFETVDEDGLGNRRRRRRKKSVKGRLWIVLATLGTVTTRGLLRGDFPYPLYFLLLLQITSYITVVVALLAITIINWRKPKRRSDEEYTLHERLIIGGRVLISAWFTAVAMMLSIAALNVYNNLSILAMLPVFTFVSDSIVFRMLQLLRISRKENVIIEWWSFWIVFLIPACLALAVYTDYRLDIDGLMLALISCGFYTLAKAVMRIGPSLEKRAPSWDSPLYLYLLAGIPLVITTWRAAVQDEDLVAANHALGSWSIFRWIWNIAPGVILQLLFTTSLNSAYPYSSKERACGALEDPSSEAKAAVRATLHTGFWITIFGALGDEYSLVDWFQTLSIVLIYIASVGPRHIGFYPPRFFNFLTRMIRRKPLPVTSEPWQFPAVLIGTTIMFAVLMSCNVMFWIDTASFNRDAKSWLGPRVAHLDTQYVPPRARSMEIVIAHSPGDSLDTLRQLITDYTSIPQVAGFNPNVIIYTKDSTLKTVQDIKSPYAGPVSMQNLFNSGGPTASFLHHILLQWETFSQQTLFLTTSPTTIPTDLPLNRMRELFIPGSFPLADAGEKTAFLNLGPQSVCHCGECSDETGWEDSFRLIPSMWGAARPGVEKCESVLLVRENKFVASAARIRGVQRDVYQLLYDALVKTDTENAWAHDRTKLPQLLPYEPLIGKWAKGVVGNVTEGKKELPGVYGLSDNLERPWLGSTVERLWAILLGCSTPEIAWRCPSLEKGWRIGFEKRDCECID